MAKDKLQGEGDRESARRFNEASQEFVTTDQKQKSAKVTDHRGRHSPEEIKKAEEKAANRAKENDPEAVRDFSKPVN